MAVRIERMPPAAMGSTTAQMPAGRVTHQPRWRRRAGRGRLPRVVVRIQDFDDFVVWKSDDIPLDGLESQHICVAARSSPPATSMPRTKRLAEQLSAQHRLSTLTDGQSAPRPARSSIIQYRPGPHYRDSRVHTEPTWFA